MKWFFRKEKIKAIEPREFEIPAEMVREVRALHDKYIADGRADAVAHYDVWAKISEICPEPLNGKWRLTFPSALTAKVVERLD